MKAEELCAPPAVFPTVKEPSERDVTKYCPEIMFCPPHLSKEPRSQGWTIFLVIKQKNKNEINPTSVVHTHCIHTRTYKMGHTYIISSKPQIMLRKQIIDVSGYSTECPTARHDINLFL